MKKKKTLKTCLHLCYQVPTIERNTLVDCAAMLAGDVRELTKAIEVIKVRPKVPIYEETYLEWTKDCAEFRTRRGYVQVGYNVIQVSFSGV